PKLGGLDWQKVHDELRPRVEKAVNAAEVRAILGEMLDRLKQTHFGIVPAEVYSDLQTGTKGGGTSGVELRLIEGKAIVTNLEPGSPGEKMGVKRGWELLRVDGKEIAPVLQKITTSFKDSTQLDLMASRRLQSFLDGEVGTTVEVLFGNGTTSTTLRLGRTAPRGKTVTFGNMPSMSFWVEHRTLPGQIGYLKFNAWFEPMAIAEAFQASLKDSGTLKGFVIDLRGNPGGIGGMAMGAAGWFTDKADLKLGTMIMRGTTLNFVVFPRPSAFAGPLAILVDGCSGSTSEIFAGGMQDIHRARVFGGRSAGAALPSVFERLPNGDGFQYAIANYISEGGQPLEGRGVTPDEEVRPTQRELLMGKDPTLDRALAWIQRPAN
ncbi:MAG: S41 family peptidase, partial [Holophaga sp.]|nr:S41 family peptidase [Holophaga sp.]